MRTLGFIGLGHMGGPIAARLLAAGYELVVFDLRPSAMAPLVANGAQAASSIADLADRAEVVLASLPTPEAVREVAIGPGGVIEGAAVRSFVDLSTTGPRVARQVAEALAGRGVAAVDAPVSGGPAGAAAGSLSVMVSGPPTAVQPLIPVFEAFGRPIPVGDQPGAGQTMKLVNNLLSVCAIAITAEGMAMGARAGLDPKTMIEVLNISSGRNSATADKWPRSVLTGGYDFGFPTRLSQKDVRLALEEAEALGVPMVVGSAVRQMLAMTAGLFGPDSDFTSLAMVPAALAGRAGERGE